MAPVTDRLAAALAPLPDQLSRMQLRPVVRSLTSLLIGIGVLFVGSGLLGLLIPLWARLEGFPSEVLEGPEPVVHLRHHRAQQAERQHA